MKKFLPKSLNNPQGFTLVELLVVISIIAILSVIGMVIFTGLSKNARDAKRKEDIQAIAKALEINYSESTAKYQALATTQFAGSIIPTDPQNGAANCLGGYCGYCGVVAPNSIPTVCTSLIAISATNPVPALGGQTWTICANLETQANGKDQYCATNSR